MYNNSIFIFKGFFLIAFINIIAIINNTDMWDGVILTRASELNDFRGIKLWFFESRWVGQYYLEYILYWFSTILNTSFYQVSKLIQILSLLISYYSIKKILILKVKVKNNVTNIILIY